MFLSGKLLLILVTLGGLAIFIFSDDNSAKKNNPMLDIPPPLIIKKNDEFIFHYNFEELNKNAKDSEICSYLNVFNQRGGYCELTSNTKIVSREKNNKALRVYQNNHVKESRYLFKLETPIFDDYEELYIGYWIRFSDNFSLGKGGKLPGGLLGVVKGEPYPTHGNEISQDSGFSVRSMFYTRGYSAKPQDNIKYPSLYTYVYHQNMSGKFGDRQSYAINSQPIDFIRKDMNSHIAEKSTPLTKYFEPGYFIETHVKMNSINKSDGLVEVFINGRQVLRNNTYTFSYSKSYGINKATFSFFYGGDMTWKPESNINDKSYLEIDDITLSSKPISH